MGDLGLMGCDVVKIILIRMNVELFQPLPQSKVKSQAPIEIVCFVRRQQGGKPARHGCTVRSVKTVTYDRWSGWCFHQG